MSKNEAFRILFALHLITQNSSGFPQSQIDMLSLLESINVRRNLYSQVIQILFTGMYYLYIPLFLLDSPCLQILFYYEARIGVEFY